MKLKGCFKEVKRVFEECFKDMLFCNFVVPWQSSQLPQQNEGLFLKNSWFHDAEEQ